MSNYNSTLQSNNTDLQAILNTINELPEVTEQATPVISVNTSGLITTTAGTKSSTYQLAFQPAKTITPSTASQIAVSSGYYTGGNVMVDGDANLVASNIKSGVSIFGVSGNYAGSGGDTSAEDSFVTRKFTSYTNDRVTTIGEYAFAYYSGLTYVGFPAVTTIGRDAFTHCSNLTSISFPVATSIGQSAFVYCSKLTSVNFPAVSNIAMAVFYSCSRLTSISFPVATIIGPSAFAYCSKLTSVNFPAVSNIGNGLFSNCYKLTSVDIPNATTIGNSAFLRCSILTSVNFPKITEIGYNAFCDCSSLGTIYLGASTVCTLSHSNAFLTTAIGSNKGYIFVPSSLVSAYKTATNWTFFSARIYSM